jgi:hypothetical protein
MTERKCDQCGEGFWPGRYWQRFCCRACYLDWNRAAAKHGRDSLQWATTYAALAAGALGDECGGRYAIARPKPLMTALGQGPSPDAVPG